MNISRSHDEPRFSAPTSNPRRAHQRVSDRSMIEPATANLQVKPRILYSSPTGLETDAAAKWGGIQTGGQSGGGEAIEEPVK
jgi:hypothetical protein